jgi:putative ABC transport system permease protein
MRALRAWLLRLGEIFSKRRRDRELAAELESHLQMNIDDNLRAGMKPEEARRQALLTLGGLEQTKEMYRDRRGLPWLETLLQDARFGLRKLAKTPGLTVILVITLALGVAANTVVFSIVNGFLLRPLPVPHPDEITRLAANEKGAALPSYTLSHPEFVDLQKQATAFSGVFAFSDFMGGLSYNGRADATFMQFVSGNFFSVLGVHQAAGRLFLPDEGKMLGTDPYAVLGYSYWQKRFGGDPAIVGKQLLIDGKAVTVIGVVAKQFRGVEFFVEPDAYLPLSMMTIEPGGAATWTNRQARTLEVMGRLAPCVSIRRARSSLDVIAAQWSKEYPTADQGMSVRVVPERLARPQPYPTDIVPVIAGFFLALAGLVLLLACINVANILLARATVRHREMAVRAALGAGPGRLMRQMLTESFLLALLGGVAGVLLAEWSFKISHKAVSLGGTKLHIDFNLDWRVLAYCTAAIFITAIVVGIWPAVRASRTNVGDVLHEEGRGDSPVKSHNRVRKALVVLQVAGSLTLLVVAGLFILSLEGAEHMSLGFNPEHVLNVILDPTDVGYNEAQAKEFYLELKSRVGKLPGVESVSLAYSVPLGDFSEMASVYVEDHPVPTGQQPPSVLFNAVSPDYFANLQIPLLRGRAITEADNGKAPLVAVVNQTMAERMWPGQDPLGNRFSMKGPSGPFVEVVGVAKNGKYNFIAEPSLSYFFVPLAQHFVSMRSLQVRTLVPPENLITEVQKQVQALDPNMPITDLETMNQALEGVNGFLVFQRGSATAAEMGLIGLLLAMVGVYGVVSFATSLRTREIGIRVALGASRADILRLVMRQGFRLIVGGIAAGFVAAWGLAHAMASMLIGASPFDPATYATVAALLIGVGLLACWIPARRAMRVDPMVALRHE